MTNKICKKAKQTMGKMNDLQDVRGETGISARLVDAKGRTLCAMHNSYSFRIPMVALLIALVTVSMMLTLFCLCRRKRKCRHKHGDAVYC